MIRQLVADRESTGDEATRDAPPLALDFGAISALTDGYTPADLKDLVELSVQESMIRSTSDAQDVRPRRLGLIALIDSLGWFVDTSQLCDRFGELYTCKPQGSEAAAV